MSEKKETEVTPSELINILNVLIETGVTPFIWGGPGIGKSSIVKSIAEKKGLNIVDIRLSMMDPVSLMGVMIPDASNGQSNWLPPSFFNNKEPTLYFFDELNSAPPTIQAAAYQIILDRRIGPHKLKESDIVIAAGNNMNDKGVTFKMPHPLLNRFVHLNLCVNFDDFLAYAIKNNFHPHVVGYLNYQKGDLYNPIYTSNVKGFPTPRSWEFVSKILNKEKNLNDNILLPMISGAVGEGSSYKFISYRKIANSIVNIDDILKGNIKESKPNGIDATYALVTGLCYSLANYKKEPKETFDKYCENFMSFLLNEKNEIKPEMVIMAVRNVLNLFDIDVNMELPSWDKFFSSEKYSRLISGVFANT